MALLEKHLELARRAHLGVSFFPDTRARQYVDEFSKELENDLDSVRELGGDAADYQQKFERYFAAWLSAKSNCISSMITGGSKFPVARAEKANRSEDNRYKEFKAFREKYLQRLRRDRRREARANIDPVAEMQGKIEKAERLQEVMKAANRIVKSKKTEAEKVAELLTIGIAEGALHQLFKPDWAGRIGFADYQLTNNLANIRRMRERLAELEKKTVAETKETEREDGIRVVENTEADRLQIFFPGKPAYDTIQLLKSRGFKWSPSNGCWQRQLTSNAVYALNQILSPKQAQNEI